MDRRLLRLSARARAALLLLVLLPLLPLRILSAQDRPSPPSPSAPGARRRAALQVLGERVLLIPSASAFMTDDQPGFKQATDFFYFTGLEHVVGGVLALDGSRGESVLFVPPPSPVISFPNPAVGAEGARAAGVDAVLPVDSLAAWLARGFPRWTAALVAPTDPRGAIAAPLPMANSFVRWRGYLASLGFQRPVTSSIPVTRALREVKDSAEVEILGRVGALSGRAMLAGMRALHPGRTQRDAEAAIVSACVAGGGVHSFWPWAMSGPNAVYTHLFDAFVSYDSKNRVMRAGELVRVDVGCRLEQYMGDVGRTAPVSGRFSPGQREAWDLFIAGYRAGLAVVRDGVSVPEVWEAARARIRQLQPGLRTALGRKAVDELLSPRGIEAWQFHNVGLDDAEGAPVRLKSGMVLAYEIMFAVEGEGFYLEDMLLVDATGHRMLTPGLPYTAAEIERAMGPSAAGRSR